MNESNTSVITRRDLIKIMAGAGISVGAAAVLAGPLTQIVEKMVAPLIQAPAGAVQGLSWWSV